MPADQYKFQTAIEDFHSARQHALIQEILARLTGKSTRLLSYEEVAKKLRLRARSERGIQHIPIHAIVGSVGRYTDFTRTFLPRRGGDRERSARVKAAFMEEGAGLPPIEVYKVGEAYFVIDGNHRVSIARQEGLTAIEARVIELRFFGGLSVEETALVLKVSRDTVLRDWRLARAWLMRELLGD